MAGGEVGHGLDPSNAPSYASHNDYGRAVLLAAMHETGVRRLVLAGSMVVYGEGRYSCPAMVWCGPAAGIALAGHGGWLLCPHLPAAATWLIAGPILHEAVVAPLIGLTGLALARAVPSRPGRRWVATALAITGTLLLIAVPLVW